MNDSHRSLCDLYKVSCDELDCMVEAVERHPACFDARRTAAGFGGYGMALVRRSTIDDLVASVHEL